MSVIAPTPRPALENSIMGHGKNIPEARLLAAVIALALRDLARRPYERNKKWRMQAESLSAARFLFTQHSDGYLEMLDIDPGSFRERLIKMMSNRKDLTIGEFDAAQRRAMKHNYTLWQELKALWGDNFIADFHEEDDDDQDFE